MASFIEHLRSKLSPSSTLLTPSESGFSDALKRWSDLYTETPLAIVQVSTEGDIVLSVKNAVAAGIAFVPACGGHSAWSTVKDGLIIDLSKYKHVEVKTDDTVSVTGGVLMKEFQTALSNKDRFAAVARGSTVGVIPYYINGGTSTYTPLIGYACENILSARIVTATGDIQDVTDETDPELLWGIRGAGQFLGLVVELRIRTYPTSMIAADGCHQMATYFFTADKAQAVCEAMTAIANDTRYVHAGHILATSAPPDYQHRIILVAPQFFGSAEEFSRLLEPLRALGPSQQVQMTRDFLTHGDHLDYLCGKGDYRKFSQIGLDAYRPENFVKVVERYGKLCKECPGAEKSGCSFEWHTPRGPTAPQLDTAFGMAEIQYWGNVLSWYHDATQHGKVIGFDGSVREALREGMEPESYVAYTNALRDVPLEHRYKGSERVARLKALKKKWDPSAVFTRELL